MRFPLRSLQMADLASICASAETTLLRSSSAWTNRSILSLPCSATKSFSKALVSMKWRI